MEYRDLYDENRKFTGEKVAKGQPTPKGRFHVTVMVFITNSKNQILLQKRSQAKGGLWATTGGHPTTGQTSLQGIHTEILEELGLDVNKGNLKLFKTVKTDKSFVDLYHLQQDVDLATLKLQKEEVSDVKWATCQDIEDLIKHNLFFKPHIGEYNDFLNLVYMKY